MTVYGVQGLSTESSEYNVLYFIFNQLLAKLNTITLVKVLSYADGYVSVQPLVNQMTGNREPQPHGEISNFPVFRLQGGGNAFIVDPQVGDIGIAAFCSRDISLVKATKAPANPGSFSMFDWADGLYFGGVLNGAATAFVQIDADGAISMQSAPGQNITLNGVTIDPNGNVASPGDVVASGVSLVNHLTPPGTFTADGDPVVGESGAPIPT